MAHSRIIAIGDIHGCLSSLEHLVDALELVSSDTLVMLGDAIDRGPDSKGVMEFLLRLQDQVELISIVGNHEQMLLDATKHRVALQSWLTHGGAETLESYGGEVTLSCIPDSHLEFIRSWRDYFETPANFFAHGNYLPKLPLAKQPWEEVRWESLNYYLPGPHCSGKTAILGHTSNKQGEILNAGHLVCIDTYCCGGGWLTALEPETGRVWQTSESGEYREGELPPPG